MTDLIAAARLMIERYGGDDKYSADGHGHTWCHGCGVLSAVPHDQNHVTEHVEGCPAVVMPQIVAALEAAAAVFTSGYGCVDHVCEECKTLKTALHGAGE